LMECCACAALPLATLRSRASAALRQDPASFPSDLLSAMTKRMNWLVWGLAVAMTGVAVRAPAAPSVARGSAAAPFRVSVKAKRWVVTLAPPLQRAIAEHFPEYAIPQSGWFEHIHQPGVERVGETGP